MRNKHSSCLHQVVVSEEKILRQLEQPIGASIISILKNHPFAHVACELTKEVHPITGEKVYTVELWRV